jgi:hypothetical protein
MNSKAKAIIVIAGIYLGLLWFQPQQVFSWDGTEPLIIDHTAVQQFNQIPDYWLDQARRMSVYYGHTSHGSQIVAGLNYLEAYIDPAKYKFKASMRYSLPVTAPAQENPPALLMTELGAQPYEYWEGTAAQDETIRTINSLGVDLAGWAWCGQHGNTSMVQSYLNAMQRIENGCQGAMHFYMTGHGGNSRVRANNQTIRQYCIDNNKILFDFEDIEYHDPDGNYYPNEDGTGTWCAAWVQQNPGVYSNIPPRVETGGGGDNWMRSSHAHGLFTIMKAQAFWYMMARLAGWDGGGGTPPPTVFYGDVSENGALSAYDASLTAQHTVRLISLTANQITKADVTGNGSVSATDASWIARKAVDSTTQFPVE